MSHSNVPAHEPFAVRNCRSWQDIRVSGSNGVRAGLRTGPGELLRPNWRAGPLFIYPNKTAADAEVFCGSMPVTPLPWRTLPLTMGLS